MEFTSNNMDSPSYTDIKKFYDVNLSEKRMKTGNFGLVRIKAEGSADTYDPNMTVLEARRLDVEAAKIPPPETKVLVPYDSIGDDGIGASPTTKYVCPCGGESFTAHFKSGGYETSIECLNCHEMYIIHEG